VGVSEVCFFRVREVFALACAREGQGVGVFEVCFFFDCATIVFDHRKSVNKVFVLACGCVMEEVSEPTVQQSSP